MWARLTLAAALLFGSEILLWNDPPARTVLDWALLGVGYVAVSALLLDFGARYRVRDVFGLIVLAGLYGLLNGTLLNPQTALLDVPRTLVTRVLGAHTLAALVMFALLLAWGRLTRTHYLAAGLIGLAWGVWVRWLPTLADTISAAVPLPTLLMYGAGGLGVLLVLAALTARAGTLTSLRLTLREWVIVAAALLVLFVRNALGVDVFAQSIVSLLLIFCGVLLWFQKRDRGASMFDALNPPAVPRLIILAAIFLAAGAVGYLLPLDTVSEPLTVYVALFTAFGVVWLPSVSLVLGIRAWRRLTRQRLL